jgi:multiple sugar transport system permease protein
VGYGAAMSWVLLIIIVVLTVIQFRSQGKWVYYQGE